MDEANGGITRRAFLGAGAAGGVALLSGGFSSVVQAAAQVDGGPPNLARKVDPATSIADEDGASIESRADKRVSEANRAPESIGRCRHRNEPACDRRRHPPGRGAACWLHPRAVARYPDSPQRQHRVHRRHGDDCRLAGTRGQQGAGRRDGGRPITPGRAVILGKANLSEWANFRGFAPFNGWSARGGFTRDPYRLDFDPCGSSSVSAVAPALNLCAGAVGSETDGSIVCPSGNNLVVGLKPTLGLLSGDGIIPIAHSQDTAGPMCRTVTDAAILLGAMQSPVAPVAGNNLPTNYRKFLQRGSLAGKRIGVDRRYLRRTMAASRTWWR